jgi:glutaredoxin
MSTTEFLLGAALRAPVLEQEVRVTQREIIIVVKKVRTSRHFRAKSLIMKLELYHFESCPYCAKVRNFIDQSGIKPKITYHDTQKDSKAHDQLMKMNGDDQVPCLVIDGKPMLESDDIISWLKSNVKK